MPSSLAPSARRVAAGTGLSLALLLAAATAAQAQSQTRTYTSAGEYSFTVPANTTSLSVQAIGGAGGNVLSSGGAVLNAGGQGRQVNASIPVTPGEVLFVEVGANGGPGTALAGAGGGGASDLRTCSAVAPSCGGGLASLQTRLVVAGGGGGAGGSAAGGNGGDSDESGGNAIGSPGTAGQNGTVTAGGAGGTAGYNGGNGVLGTGGLGGESLIAFLGGGSGGANGGANGGDTDGTNSGGGGAGGGYYGGGGGSGSSIGAPGGGGGGGGGATYITPGATTSSTSWASQAPSVSLTWTPTVTPPAPTQPPLVSSIVPPTGWTTGGQVVTVNGAFFAQARAVYFGTVAAPTYTVTGFSTITAVVPANVAGIVNVTVVGQGGTSKINTNDVFTYMTQTPTPGPTPPTPTPSPTPAPPTPSQPTLCVVPNVIGTSLSAARRLLSEAHCAVGTVVQPSGRSGLKVVRQTIPPRTRLLPGDKVGLRLNGQRR